MTRCRFFFAPETPKSAVQYAKKSIPEGKRAISALQNEGNPSFSGSLPDLFLVVQNRYDSIREVATHKIRNTVTQGEGYDRKVLQWNEEKRSGCIC